jgi:hypothetical protein
MGIRTASVWAVVNDEESVGGDWLICSLWTSERDALEEAQELNDTNETEIFQAVNLDIN